MVVMAVPDFGERRVRQKNGGWGLGKNKRPNFIAFLLLVFKPCYKVSGISGAYCTTWKNLS